MRRNKMPQVRGIDEGFNLVKQGYSYMLNRRRQLKSNVFEMRLFGKKVICMGGRNAAELFYDEDKFERKGAVPNRVIQTLFGQDGVQTLDGEEHRHRKQLLLSILKNNELNILVELTEKEWDLAVNQWISKDSIVFYEEVKELLTRVACKWVGVPVKETELKGLSDDLAAMFECASKIGPNHWRGRQARNRVEKWLQHMIQSVRNRELDISNSSLFHTFIWHRDLNGNLLDNETAAVEVINLLRPVVAISVFINFIFLALYEHPEQKEKIRDGDDTYIDFFVQEVRRFYPFFPALIAKVKRSFIWNSYAFKQGTLTMLDLYGTNNDPELWNEPHLFNPNRFATKKEIVFDLIPQGGGDYANGHRCPAEINTIEVMKVGLDFLVNRIDYDVPNQDVSYSMSLVKAPSIPQSKIILKNIKRK